MKKIIFLIIGIIIMIFTMNVHSSVINFSKIIVKKTNCSLNGTIIYVGGDGPGNHTNIQDAIDIASDNDTIFVYDDSAPYYENITIHKSILLLGENRNTTIIDGEWGIITINVEADNVIIKNFNFTRGEVSILIYNSSNTQITNNIFQKTGDGIVISYSSNCTINDNIILDSFDGIGLWHSENIIAYNNLCSDIDNNGFSLGFSNYNIIKDNSVSFTREGIEFVDSKWNVLINNTIRKNRKGIGFYTASHNIISNNTIIDNRKEGQGHGMVLGDSSRYNNITNNMFRRNHIGMSIGSGRNIIANNTFIRQNYRSVYLHKPKNNSIYHNIFIRGGACDYGKNIWNDSYPSGGNYWRGYKGEDNYKGPNQDIPGSDGIGDTPKPIKDGYGRITGYDYYPWMEHGLGNNTPPSPPVITGQTLGYKNKPHKITYYSIDPDGHYLDYLVLWGNGGVTNWRGPYPSGKNITDSWEYTENGTYTIKVIVMDEFGGLNEGTFNVTIESGTDLFCTGSLHWKDVKPGDTVTGNFTVENIGDSDTELNWEIQSFPKWGTWTFSPSNSSGLRPEDGPMTVNVSVVAPGNENTDFSGKIKVVNLDKKNDYEEISVTLSTPRDKSTNNIFLLKLLERFPLLQRLLDIWRGSIE